MRLRYFTCLRPLLALAMFISTSMVPAANAAMVPTEFLLERSAPGTDRQAIQDMVSRGEIRGQLQALGVDPKEATRRVAALSDAEVARLHGGVTTAPAGGIIVLLLILLSAYVLNSIHDGNGDPQCYPEGSSC